MDIQDLLRGALERNQEDSKPMGKAAQKERSRLLQAVRTKFLEHNTFAPGDLVVCKDGCRTYRIPAPEEPAIVTELLDPPLRSKADTSNNHAQDIEDIVIGVMIDGVFNLFSVDSRRFEHWKE